MEILPQVLINGIIAGSVMALMAMGLSLIYGVLKFMNFAHGEMAMLGAFFYYYFFIHLAWPLLPSLLAAVVLCGITGIIFNKLIFQPLRNESPWTLLITSIGVSLFIKSTMLLVATGKSRSYLRDDYETDVYELWGGKMVITDYQLVILGTTIAVLIGMALFMKYTKTGKAIRAVSDNMQMASILGIDVKRTITKIFIISTALAGLAGVLIGYEQNLTPNMGLVISILAFAAVIVGGLGNIWGAVVGAMVIGIAQNVLVSIEIFGHTVPTSYKSAIAFGILILMLILRPRGLFGISLEEEASRK
ncbi:MAG: branched-chain amino acid ABC transporter permease [Candidatus Peregrinibacteria bacterium]|nr:branched-chain amino acid ABC transporter permease [Candidatus Peregrinibacteria bacterium]